MKVSLLDTKENPKLLKRLQTFGFNVQADLPNNIKSIDKHTTDLVYLISYSLTLLEDWSDTRVRLARAGRFYLVCGSNLGSKEIVYATRDGAHDVLINSDSDIRWEESIKHAIESQQLWWQLYGGSGQMDPGRLVGRSGAMKSLRESLQRLGPTEATVLVIGESGTGKERVSEALHTSSGKKAFVPVNCAAIPKDLMESELFGVEKGAFTGAVKSKHGLVEEAEGGTLFLDEIGELDMALQPKLLRFLETRYARRVGSTKQYRCEVRVISATNKDLEKAIDEGTFRADLYYRLAEIIINIPPLRHRLSDIPDLTSLFVRESAERLGKNIESLEPELIYKLQQYEWPGNVRELKQVIDRMSILYDGPVLRAAWWEIPQSRESRKKAENAKLNSESSDSSNLSSLHSQPPSGAIGLPGRKEKLSMAKQLLKESDNDLTWVAAHLGIHPTTLYRWRKQGKV